MLALGGPQLPVRPESPILEAICIGEKYAQ